MEFDYIAWLRSRTPADPRVRIGPGDDCAALAPPTRELLVTTDMLMDGTDFHVSEVGPRRAGRKAMAANLSDIAAMAGVPIAAVVSVALPVVASGGGSHPPLANRLRPAALPGSARRGRRIRRAHRRRRHE